jgi:glycosyltransferase involved in cell wall biosynthesis
MILPWLEMGGSDKFNLDLVEQLLKRGWEVTIATTLEGADAWQSEFERHTPDIFLLHRFLPLLDFPRFLRYLARSRQVDLVFVSHSELGYQLLPYLRAHLPDVPFVDFCHIEEHWKNGGYPRLAVEFQELFDVNVVSSEHLKRWMVARGAEADRIQVCYTGIDTDLWRPDAATRTAIRRELEAADTMPIILYVGRICDQKQPRVFAETMQRLYQSQIPFVALVAGDGPDLGWLRRFVHKKGLRTRVQLLGAQSSQRISQLMKAADIFFLPSAREGIALSIYEAMASGLPVVGANVGGQRELVTPDCGTLIERSDERSEAEEYARILAELAVDPARRKSLGDAGRARVSHRFRIEHMGERMVELFARASTLHDTQPRPVPGLGSGRAAAAQTIEFARTGREFEQLWHAWHSGSARVLATGPTWRERVYTACRVLYGPLHRRGVERGGAWYFPLASRIKSALLRPR